MTTTSKQEARKLSLTVSEDDLETGIGALTDVITDLYRAQRVFELVAHYAEEGPKAECLAPTLHLFGCAFEHLVEKRTAELGRFEVAISRAARAAAALAALEESDTK